MDNKYEIRLPTAEDIIGWMPNQAALDIAQGFVERVGTFVTHKHECPCSWSSGDTVCTCGLDAECEWVRKTLLDNG